MNYYLDPVWQGQRTWRLKQVKLRLDQIRMDGGTQSRAQLDWVAIDEYAASMKEGEQFPPVIVYHDGTEYWLADGFHRVRATEKAGLAEVDADVRQGTRRDAILYSVGANANNGVRRNQRDKRQAVVMLLTDEVWREMSDQEIARHCSVHWGTVGRIRAELISRNAIDASVQRTFVRNGTAFTMDTSNIGKNQPPTSRFTPHPNLIETIPDRMVEIAASLLFGEAGVEPLSARVLPIIVHNKDARFLSNYLDEACVQLVITSPPYNVGIDYDAHSDELSTYYNLLKDVWAECHKVLVDGGRICVNVPFGVGRNPWVPMALDVMRTLTDAGFTLRGQIIWDKGTTGNRTSWGSFRLPTDPGLRDTTECVIVAHKGQSNLEIPTDYRLRDEKGSYTAWLADSDYFMELAQDHWQIAPESAQRVKHPAPFPTELVRRLIHFYGFPGCHVVDPFAGSGTVGVVAKQLGCQATLFEISQDYCRLAEERINEELPIRSQ
jgi:site-specific DNA-methyltransferase (adenine-specific)